MEPGPVLGAGLWLGPGPGPGPGGGARTDGGGGGGGAVNELRWSGRERAGDCTGCTGAGGGGGAICSVAMARARVYGEQYGGVWVAAGAKADTGCTAECVRDEANRIEKASKKAVRDRKDTENTESPL